MAYDYDQDDRERFADEAREPWQCIWSGEEVEILFSATPEQTDLGVPRSPVEIIPTDITIEEITILGISVPESSLPEALQVRFYELAEDLSWDQHL